MAISKDECVARLREDLELLSDAEKVKPMFSDGDRALSAQDVIDEINQETDLGKQLLTAYQGVSG